jgi:uncharacterized protein YjbJ (UPF0337 family)
MNKDQVKGAIKEAAGKLQTKTGKIIGNNEQQVKGISRTMEGHLQKSKGDAKEIVKDVMNKSR